MVWMAFHTLRSGVVEPTTVLPPVARNPALPPATVHEDAPAGLASQPLVSGAPAFDAGQRYLRMCGATWQQSEDGPVLRLRRGGVSADFRWDGTQWTWPGAARTEGWQTWVPTADNRFGARATPLREEHHVYLDAVAARLTSLTASGGAGAQTETLRIVGSYDMFHRYISSQAEVVGEFQGENVYRVTSGPNVLRFRYNSTSGQVEYSRSSADFLPSSTPGGLPTSTWVSISTPRPLEDQRAALTPLYRIVDRVREIAPADGTTVTAATFREVATTVDVRQNLRALFSQTGAQSEEGSRTVWRFPGSDIILSMRRADGVVEYSTRGGEDGSWVEVTRTSPAPYIATPRTPLTERQTAGNRIIEGFLPSITGGTPPAAATNLQITQVMQQLITGAGGQRLTYIPDSNEYYIQLSVATEVYFRPTTVDGRTEWTYSFEPPPGRRNTAERIATFRPISEFAADTNVTSRNTPEMHQASRMVETLLVLQRGAAGSDADRTTALAAATSRAMDHNSFQAGQRMLRGLHGVVHPQGGGQATSVLELPDNGDGGLGGTIFRVTMPEAFGSRVMDYRFNPRTCQWEWRNPTRFFEGADHQFYPDNFIPCGTIDINYPTEPAYSNEAAANGRWRRVHNQAARILEQLNRRP